MFDEHGGLYDHVPPPTTVAPDNHPSDSSYVDFKHLGVRVPAIVISPYAPAMSDARTYDHTSVIATAGKLCGLDVPRTLGLRAAQAAAFVQMPLPPSRTDTPTSVDPTTSTDLHYDPNVPLDDNQRLESCPRRRGRVARYHGRSSGTDVESSSTDVGRQYARLTCLGDSGESESRRDHWRRGTLLRDPAAREERLTCGSEVGRKPKLDATDAQ